MCFDQGHIQSYIDGELPVKIMEETREHLETCGDCREIYERLLDSELVVRTSMEGFLAADRERFNAELAWQKLKLQSAGKKNEKGKEVPRSVRYKKLFTSAVAAAALAALFGFTPVRTMAADFLTIFRVEKVGVIAITPDDMMQMEKVMREGSGLADIKNFGRVEVSGRQELRAVTAQEARQAVDFDLTVPAVKGYGDPELKLMSGSSVTLAPDVEKLNAALQALGSKDRLPAELNGREFTLVVPPVVTAGYSGPSGEVMLAQSRGPSIRSASGVDVMAVRKALLGIPALPENLRRQLAAVDSWQNTALIPVRDGQYSEVQVNGAGGVFLKGESRSGGPAANALVWQKNGVIYVLGGQGMGLEAALNIAGGMK